MDENQSPIMERIKRVQMCHVAETQIGGYETNEKNNNNNY